MYRSAVRVSLPGPPPVMICDWPTMLNDAITCNVMTSKRIGRRLGTVTDLNCCHLFAPSIDDASYRSGAIAWSPASRMIVLKPTVHHRVAVLIENHASGLVVSQLTFSTPKLARRIVNNPDWLFRSHHQSSPMTPIPSVHGAKK